MHAKKLASLGIAATALFVFSWIQAAPAPPSAPPADPARAAWTAILKRCTNDAITGSGVVFFGPSNGVGPGSLWHKSADGRIGIRRSLEELAPTVQARKALIVRGKDVSCRSTASSDLKANAGVMLSSALSKMDGSLSAQLDHATSVEVNIAAWATDSLLEGPYEDRLFDLPLQNHFRRDATSEDRFVVVKALRVRGLTVTLGFTKEDSAKVKAQVAGLLKPIANVSVGLSGNWDSDNTLTLHANEDFYLFGEFARLTDKGIALNGATLKWQPAVFPIGTVVGIEKP